MFYNNINPDLYASGLVFNCKNFVSESFVQRVETYIEKQELEIAKLQSNASATTPSHDLSIRDSEIHWMDDEEAIPLYDDLTPMLRGVNGSKWDWVIDSWESFQYSEYNESYNGHYDWHIDYTLKEPGQPLSRKLSFSLGISNKDDYEGGQLITKVNREEPSYKLDRGEIIIFPSWMLHKVTHVTRGLRKVIVGWGRGPVI